MNLEIGKVYAYDDWMFLVLKRMDTSSFDVLILYDSRDIYKAGVVMALWDKSIAAEFSQEVK